MTGGRVTFEFIRRAMNTFTDKKAAVGKTRVFCVSHEPPLVPDALADFVIGIGDYHPDPSRGLHISSLDSYWDEMRPYAYGAAGNYVIPKAMDIAGMTKYTAVFSHRKIIVRTQIGRECPPPFSFYNDVDLPDAAKIPRTEIEPRDGFDFLIGFPLRCRQTIVAQYIEDHKGLDLFDYVSMAVDMGILPVDEAQAFSTEQFFIVGGCESGVYPTEWVRPVLEGLAKLGREFITRRASRIRTYDNYQVRAVGFLAERLGSYLLLSELRRRYPTGLPREICGHLCVLVPPGGTYDCAVIPGPAQAN